MFIEVLVGNIGKVWEGDHWNVGREVFAEYVKRSTKNWGKAAGEDVTLWIDGDIFEEFMGSITMGFPE